MGGSGGEAPREKNAILGNDKRILLTDMFKIDVIEWQTHLIFLEGLFRFSSKFEKPPYFGGVITRSMV